MRERDIERWLCMQINARGGLSIKFRSTTRGWPDRLVILPRGKVWFVEIKSDHGRLSELQHYQAGRLAWLGANARVVYGLDGAKAFVDEVFSEEESPNGI